LQVSWQPKQLRVLIILVTLGLCAYFLARGATNLVALKALPYHVPMSAALRGTGAAAELKGERPPDAHAILKRNFFDSATGPLWPPKEDPTELAAADVTEHNDQSLAEGQMPPPCEGGVRLVASMFDPRDDDWSFASIATGTGSPLLYRLGNPIETKKVEAIYPEAVFLKAGNGALCSLTMFKSANAPPPKPNAPPPPAVAEAASSGDAELDQGIKQVSETKYSVRRSLVDKLLQNQSELIKQARVVPHEENGRVVGVKLYGIRKSSLFGKLGLQNGDMLRTINGFDMSSPDSALEAYTKLRSASNLSLAIVRRGNAVTMDYNIGN
jgi:general secretion pathway protein C